MSKSCTCKTCVDACRFKPGWFKPGEAEEAAKLLAAPFRKFFKTRLMVDYYGDPPDDVYLLAPAVVFGSPGSQYPFIPTGRCTFLTDDNRCEIYAARPHECRRFFHTDLKITAQRRHQAVARSWWDHQEQIRKLLGRKPVAPEPTWAEQFQLKMGLVF